mmetsp:Transcript_8581/g.17411  ORF Transcript_8581/g.17411 Transcript_8581/m.17411 type:complete len:263 (+) Transcript_8581:484-1272(+)
MRLMVGRSRSSRTLFAPSSASRRPATKSSSPPALSRQTASRASKLGTARATSSPGCTIAATGSCVSTRSARRSRPVYLRPWSLTGPSSSRSSSSTASPRAPSGLNLASRHLRTSLTAAVCAPRSLMAPRRMRMCSSALTECGARCARCSTGSGMAPAASQPRGPQAVLWTTQRLASLRETRCGSRPRRTVAFRASHATRRSHRTARLTLRTYRTRSSSARRNISCRRTAVASVSNGSRSSASQQVASILSPLRTTPHRSSPG